MLCVPRGKRIWGYPAMTETVATTFDINRAFRSDFEIAVKDIFYGAMSNNCWSGALYI